MSRKHFPYICLLLYRVLIYQLSDPCIKQPPNIICYFIHLFPYFRHLLNFYELLESRPKQFYNI